VTLHEPGAEPVIGICAVRERARWSFWDQGAHLVADSYIGFIQRAGAIAVLLPVDSRAPLALLARIDALLLIGGPDVDPGTWGAEREPGLEGTNRDRDEFEIAMLRGAIARGLPVLAICRGMQLLNVAMGGTLVQDLVGADGRHPHRPIIGSFDGTDRLVSLTAGSLVASASGEEVTTAHCHHHQAIDRVGDGLTVSARADDGVIEAIEAADGRWVLGVQWHPEAHETSRLFQALSDAAAQRPALARLE
jgi:putative glutamine amidotransferase